VVAVLQAGRGRVLAARFQWQARGHHWQALDTPQVCTWTELAGSIQAAAYVCGEVDSAGSEALRGKRGLVTLAGPAQSLRRAGYLAEIGWERVRANSGLGTEQASRLAPIYASGPAGAAPVEAAASVP
jgi:hypothetical protein